MMKRILFILAFLCVLDFAAMAQGAPPLCMSEVDGSPNKCGITRIKVTNGTLSITGSVATITISGGGGGSPGGSTTQVQYNDTGAFAGAAGFTFNGTSTVTLGVAGTSVGAIAFKNATSGTITLQPVAGALGTVTLSLPAATDTLVGLAATQTLTNKTLTAPVIATISNTGTLTLPTSTDTLVGKATTDTFTNKTLTASSNVLGGVTMTLGSDADGDIYYRSSNVLTRLPKGTALQVLRMNAGATAPEWAAAAGGGGITIGTTTITSGTDTRVLYNNAGVVGEYSITGTGNAVLSASPTLTGRISAADGLFATSVTTGTGATAGLQVTANSLTTGNGAELSSSSVTSGNVVSIAATGTAAASNTKTALNVATSGANATSTQTTYGAQVSNTSTGTSSTNVGLFATASGGTNNYAAILNAGFVGIGTTTPSGGKVHVVSGTASLPALYIQAASGDTTTTANLDFRDGSGTQVAKFTAHGRFQGRDLWAAFDVNLMDSQANALSIGVSGRVVSLGASASGLALASGYQVMWSSNAAGSGDATGSIDLRLRRAAAANLAFGAADAASPVAQTLSVQNVVAGTSNTAGANWTFAGSRGTGTGVGGDIILQTAPAGGSGTTQNTLVNAFTAKGNGAVQLLSVTFANLPTVANAYLIYCSDCTIASPCASGGSGALAKGINGAWVCN